MSYALKPTVVVGSAHAGQGYSVPVKPVNHDQTREAMRAAMSSAMASLSALQASRVVPSESLDRPLSTI